MARISALGVVGGIVVFLQGFGDTQNQTSSPHFLWMGPLAVVLSIALAVLTRRSY